MVVLAFAYVIYATYAAVESVGVGRRGGGLALIIFGVVVVVLLAVAVAAPSYLPGQ